MSKIKNTETISSAEEYAVVAYTDGSCGPSNPGFWGSGVHGYVYPLSSLGKKTANRPTNYAVTNIGYVFKDELEREPYQDVTPTHYINACYSFEGTGTNNTGELQAVTLTLMELLKITDLDIKKITIKLDSEYAIAVYNAVKNYDAVAWRDRIKKNLDYVELMRTVVREVKVRDIELDLVKVKGHSISLGNNNADRMAVMARMYSYKNITEVDFKISPAKKYYAPGTEDRHPFLRFSNLYFMGITTLKDERAIYSVMEYKKDIEPGRASHEAIFGLVSLKTKQPLIEDVISWYTQKLRPTALISTIDLDVLYSRNVRTLHELFKEKMYNFDNYFTALKFRDEETVVKAIRPPGLANSAVERTVLLYDIVDEYSKLNKEKPLREYIDITDKIFTVNEKGKNVINITNKESFMLMDVDLDGNIIKFPVFLGKDCITRDHFKQIEDLEPKVMLVIKKVGDNLLNYYILIDCRTTGDISIWCNFYNNNVLLQGAKPKGKKS